MDLSSNTACYQFLQMSSARYSSGCVRAAGVCFPTSRAETRGCAKLRGHRAQDVYDLASTERASLLCSDYRDPRELWPISECDRPHYVSPFYQKLKFASLFYNHVTELLKYALIFLRQGFQNFFHFRCMN